MRNWVQDMAFSYVAGLIAGAPIGLAGFWITARPESLTAAIATTMAAVLVARRTRRRRPPTPQPAA